MRTLIVVAIVLIVLAAGGAAAYKPAVDYWQRQNMPKWKTAAVTRGEIVSVVNATGTIKPVLQIAVGAFVSGPIDAEFQITDHDRQKLFDKNGEKKHIVEFNEEVKKGAMLAKVQDVIYRANKERDEANLDSRIADLERVRALLWQAKRDEWRALDLREKSDKFIAQSETDKAQFARMSLEAQEKLADAAVKQAAAQLKFSQAQLDYCDILAPVDGIIINRKIDPGQTLAAQFQTPELFVIGPKMRERMHVHASVDEADIGLIKKAQLEGRPVSFTVDAYPELLFNDDLFKNIDAEFKRVQIAEVRLSSTTTQNVVTYPVVVETPNPDLKLMPGMTASISFEVGRRDDVAKIPNSALRYFPQIQHVRLEDRPLLEGRQDAEKSDEQLPDSGLAAKERAEVRKKRNRRHVWVQDGYKLRAVEVETGISDSYFTELVSGDLKVDDKLVIGIHPPLPPGADNHHRIGHWCLVIGHSARIWTYPLDLLLTLRVALRALAKNKLRAGLTVLGVVIGIAAVTAMVSIGQSASELVRGQFESIGTNVIVVFPGTQRRDGVRQGLVKTLTAADSDAVGAECPSILAATPLIGAQAQVIYGNTNYSPRDIFGVGQDYPVVAQWTLASGGFFTDRDVTGAAKVCVIGHTLVRKLFQTSDPINQTIRVKNIPFRVVGVLQAKGANMVGDDQDDILLMPYTSVRKRLQGSEFDNIGAILCNARSLALVPEAQHEIAQLLAERHHIHPGEPNDFIVRNVAEVANVFNIVVGTLTMMISSIAGISLIVGGVGIMNIMLVSVTERTREIGIRMAVGARGRDILLQFLVEAVLLSCIGGLIGFALGCGTSVGLTMLINTFTSGTKWPVVISINAALLAFFFAAAVGIFFGFYPAHRASQLDPIEALRYE